MAEDEWLAQARAAYARNEWLIDLAAVHEWVQQQKGDWERQGLKVDVLTPSQTYSKNSMRVDFESDDLVAMLVVWDSGEWELERAFVATDDIAGSGYHPVTSLAALFAAISADLRRLGIVR